VVGLVIRNLAGADAPLTRDHLGGLVARPRDRDRDRARHGHFRQLLGDQLSLAPLAGAKVQQTKAREVAGRDRHAARAIVLAEGQERRIVLASDQIRQQRMQHLRIDRRMRSSVDLREERVEEQGHLPIVVGVRGPRLLDQAVAGDLVGHVTPGDAGVLVVEVGVDLLEPRLPPAHRLIDVGDSAVLDRLEQEEGVDRLGRRGDVHPPGGIAPGVDHVPVPDHAAEPADAVAEGFECIGRKPHLGRRPRRPLPAGIDRSRRRQTAGTENNRYEHRPNSHDSASSKHEIRISKSETIPKGPSPNDRNAAALRRSRLGH